MSAAERRPARAQPSLRSRLLLTVLGLLATGWLLVLGLTWLDLRDELDELLDAHLAQTAALLSDLQLEDLRNLDAVDAPVLHEYQQEVAIQVWHEGRLVARSVNAPAAPLAPLGETGFSVQTLSGEPWRVLGAPGLESDLHILVGEREAARAHVLLSSMERAVWPILLGFPLIVLGIVWAVRGAVQPLRRLGDQVAQRRPQALEPLEAQDAPREVLPLVQALNRLFERMAERLEAERRFTADAAHELRTPLAAIRMQAQVAQGALDAGERAQALAATVAACDRASHLVDQLLQLARLEAEAGTSVASANAVEAVTVWPRVVHEVCELLESQVQAKNQRLECSVASEVSPAALPAALARVLLRNLLDNAVRYSPEGARVRLSVVAAGQATRITVEDSGPGLSPEAMARLGERFFRVLGTGQPGSGLGWSIVGRLVRMYGMDVEVGRSTELGGLRVTLTVPEALAVRAVTR
jgi:two-component system sensor histidine kinase QseC